MEEDTKLQTWREAQQDENFGDWYSDAVQNGVIPSFEDFKKNPNRMRQDKENIFSQVDQGQTLLKNLKKQKYFFKTLAGNVYECASLNKVAEIAEKEGVLFSNLKPYPELREDTSCSITCAITFCPPGVTP